MRLTKRRGVFYTPAPLADVLVAWSIRSSADVVLEPSFGGCEFIASLQKRFAELGCSTPAENIYGCDIDATAFKQYLPRTLGRRSDLKNFVKADFLSMTADDFEASPFDVVIGNPPYVSHHNMFKRQRLAAWRVGSDEQFRVSRVASLWAFFVFHSLSLIRKGGRMAWVLPGSLLHADYANALLHELSRRFAHVSVISLRQRVFAAVSETTEILTCDGYGEGNGKGEVKILPAADVASCAKQLNGSNGAHRKAVAMNGRAVSALSGARKLAGFEQISTRRDVIKLGAVARFSIGIVTGANRLFVLNEHTALQNGFPVEALIPVLAKFTAARSLQLLPTDFVAAMDSAIPCLLVDGAKAATCKVVRSYFASIPKRLRETNVTFNKRPDWRCPDDDRIPDAFFPYMHHTGPRIILNRCGVNATNTIHRVYFNSNVSSSQRKLIAVSVLSSFSQLSAEIEGRSYGAGVLKHEPREARQICVILPERMSEEAIASLFKRVDSLLRGGRTSEATALVDSELMAAMHAPPPASAWRTLPTVLKELRAKRHRK